MELYPKSVSKKCHKKILDQMNEMNDSICRIKNKKDIGLFCYIEYNHNKIPVIIINDCIDNEEYSNRIKIILNNKEIIIDIDEVLYKNKYISILKIKNNNNIKYMEIDAKFFEKEQDIYYCNESIYILQNKKNDILVSYGIIKDINKNEIIYTGNINSKFSLIFHLNNNKLIGIHIKNNIYYNKGIFFKNILKEMKNYLTNINEINILVDIKKEDINKEIYFLNNTDNDIKELNKNNIELFINDKKEKYKTYIKSKKIGIYKIVLKLIIFFKILKICLKDVIK